MKVWALSDPHLSFASPKPMHIFGEHWRNHWDKIEQGWRACVEPRDVVLVTGDISWARRFARALPDLEWLDRLPGAHKLIVRGNHDLWWPESPDQRAQLPPTLRLLEGNALQLGGHIFCGTGGWLTPADPYFEPLDRGLFERELAALQRALEQARELGSAAGQPGAAIHVLLHFPPYTSDGKPTAFDHLLHRFPVRTVTFGHFHFPQEWAAAPQGRLNGVHYTLASADFVQFHPVRLPIGGPADAAESCPSSGPSGYQPGSPG